MLHKYCDRRNRVQHISLAIVVALFLFMVALATAKETGQESLSEHGVVIIDVLVYLLIASVIALVGIIVWNFNDLKNTIRQNHEETKRELRHKVSIPMHNAICDKKIELEPE